MLLLNHKKEKCAWKTNFILRISVAVLQLQAKPLKIFLSQFTELWNDDNTTAALGSWELWCFNCAWSFYMQDVKNSKTLLWHHLLHLLLYTCSIESSERRLKAIEDTHLYDISPNNDTVGFSTSK